MVNNTFASEERMLYQYLGGDDNNEKGLNDLWFTLDLVSNITQFICDGWIVKMSKTPLRHFHCSVK